MRDPFRPGSGMLLAAAAAAGLASDALTYDHIDHRGNKWPLPADPKKKAQRKAQKRARRITRQRNK